MLRFKAWKRRGMLKTCEGEVKPWQTLFVKQTDAVLSTAPYRLRAVPFEESTLLQGLQAGLNHAEKPANPLLTAGKGEGGGRATSYHATGSAFRARATMVGWYSRWAGSISRRKFGKRCGSARKAS
jgi:hypothetical protein